MMNDSLIHLSSINSKVSMIVGITHTNPSDKEFNIREWINKRIQNEDIFILPLFFSLPFYSFIEYSTNKPKK